MTISRELLDQYLDGELPPAQVAQVDQQLRDDAGAEALLARMRRERALRMAALETYQPKPEEAATLAQDWMGQFQEAGDAPVARIGQHVWLRRVAAAAAALLIAASSFWLGHLTATRPGGSPVDQPTAGGPYIVRIVSPDGTVTTQEFKTLAEARGYAESQAAQPTETVAGTF